MFVVMALAIVVLASITIGANMVSLPGLLGVGQHDSGLAWTRLLRTGVGLSIGVALGMAGACLQTMTRNRLADPGLLGINGGASLAMVLGMVLMDALPLSARLGLGFAGAMAAMTLVHAFARAGDGSDPIRLILCGAAVTAVTTSLTSALLLTHRGTLESFRFWQVGSIGGRDASIVAVAVPVLVAAAAIALIGSRGLDALALGEDHAVSLGRRVRVDKAVLFGSVSLLAGAATALAGPVAFVGLLAPNLVRRVAGGATRLLLASGLVGALLVLTADTIGRVVLPPTEVQVGVMTAVIGGPFMVVLLIRGRLS